MKLHFDANQSFQLEVINAVTDLFEGQPLKQGDFEISATETMLNVKELGFGNILGLSEDAILKKLQTVKIRNELEQTEKLEQLEYIVQSDADKQENRTCSFPNFTPQFQSLSAIMFLSGDLSGVVLIYQNEDGV
jgi:hypothetical protein